VPAPVAPLNLFVEGRRRSLIAEIGGVKRHLFFGRR